MPLNLIFLLLGAVLLAGGTVSFRGSTAISIRSISAAALAPDTSCSSSGSSTPSPEPHKRTRQ